MKKIHKLFLFAVILAMELTTTVNAQVILNPLASSPLKGFRSVSQAGWKRHAPDYSRAISNVWLNYWSVADSIASDNGYMSHQAWIGPLFDDSTVIIDHGSNSYRPWVHEFGTVFDPGSDDMKNFWSTILNFNSGSPFFIDSISLPYVYERHSASNIVDTLITYLWYPHNGAYYMCPANSNPMEDTCLFTALTYNPATNMPDINSIGDTDLLIIKTVLHPSDTSTTMNIQTKVYSTDHYEVPANRTLAAAFRFRPGYRYSAGDSISNTGNVFYLCFEEPNGSQMLCPYTMHDFNMTYSIPTDVRYNSAGGWDSLFIPTYAYSAGAYPFDELIVDYNLNVDTTYVPSSPSAYFTVIDTSICQNTCIGFYDESTGNPTSWLWNFPGGSPSYSTLQNPYVCYDTPGTYDVMLSVSNRTGGDTLLLHNYINVNSSPAPSITPGGIVSFCTGSSVNLDAGNYASYFWSTNETSRNITVDASGTYSVTVVDADGCTGTDSRTVIASPTSFFTLSPDTTLLHHYIAVNYVTGIPPLHYDWAWGDGGHDTTEYPAHTYADSGFYTICLTVTDSAGCSNTYCDTSFHALRTLNTMVTVTVIEPIITTVKEITTSEFKIYPNPATNNLTLKTSLAANTKATITIMNMLGVMADQSEIKTPQSTISISSLPAGIYILQLKTESGVVVRKFVKSTNTN